MVEYSKILISPNEIEELKKADKEMKRLIELVGEVNRDYIPNPFIALVHSIVFQQLAYKAALSIWKRFENLITDITPENILLANFDQLRECGLSKSKIHYIYNIAEAVVNGAIDTKNIHRMENGKIIETLIKIKGVGIWTAEMFLIFSLNRKDILSEKDLGIRKGLKWLYQMDHEPTKKEFEVFKTKFSPHNTLASFYLWEITIRNFYTFDNVFEIKV